MADHFTDFPFEEIRQEPDGDYFDSVQQALDAGYALTQIWSVVECDGTWTYGPSHHYINRLGYIATVEHHDGDTYYHEKLEILSADDCGCGDTDCDHCGEPIFDAESGRYE